MTKEDIVIWPDGTWCYMEDLREYLTFMSDDYSALPAESAGWYEFLKSDIGLGEVDL